MNVKRITGTAGSVGKSGLETILGVKPEQLESLAETIVRLDRDGHLMGYEKNLKGKIPQAKRLTAENQHELIETAVTKPIVQGFKTLVKLVKESLVKYIDDVKLQLMINKDRRDERNRLLQMLNGELKNIKKVEKANARLAKQQAEARAKAHKEGQDYYDGLKGEVDEFLTTGDNARIAHANKANRFFEEGDSFAKHAQRQQEYDGLTQGADYWTAADNERLAIANRANRFLEDGNRFLQHAERQQRYDDLTRGNDTWTSTDNELIAWANKANKFFEEGQRFEPHNLEQQRLDKLTQGADTWTEGDNEKIAGLNLANRFLEDGERAPEQAEIQHYFDGIGEVFDEMEAKFVDRDNTRIAGANAKFNFDNEDIEAALHALTQEGYDKFGRLLDGFSGS